MSYQFGHIDPNERLDYAEEPPPDDEDYRPRRHLGGAVLAVAVMAAFAGGLWFAYHEGTKHAGGSAPATDQVPLIRADGDPVKVKPDKAGGMDIPDKDNPVYSLRPGANPTEHILPPPEAPAPRPTAPAPVQSTAAPPPAPAPEAPAAKPAPKPAPMLTPQQVAALAKPAAKPAEEAKPAAAAADGGGMRIQLASLRTPEEARDEWARLKHDNGDLLGKLTAVAVKADLGERGIYYRVEAGPLADKATAVQLCKALKDRGLGCQLVR
jgi:cell division septation protein DedD